jgi:hypothetical protein
MRIQRGERRGVTFLVTQHQLHVFIHCIHLWSIRAALARRKSLENFSAQFRTRFIIVLINNKLQNKKYFSEVLACSGVVYYYITRSPKHPDDGRTETLNKETIMNTSISTKLAALGLALMVNSVIMGGMAYLFNAQLQQPAAVYSLAGTSAPPATGSV